MSKSLSCTECKQRNYNTMKNRRMIERLEMNKYCRFCQTHGHKNLVGDAMAETKAKVNSRTTLHVPVRGSLSGSVR